MKLCLSRFCNRVFLLVSSFLQERWRWRIIFYHNSETALLLSFTFFIFFFPLLFVVFDLLPSVTRWSFVVSEQGHGDVKRYILFRNWVISNEEFRSVRFGSRCCELLCMMGFGLSFFAVLEEAVRL